MEENKKYVAADYKSDQSVRWCPGCGDHFVLATLHKAMAELGFQFPDSQSNFLFVTHPKYSAKELYEMLKAQHIFVRSFGTGRTEPYLRITIGTEEQMEALFAALRRYFQ